MNRFVQDGSRLFLFMAWAFAATMFADAANLDDLFASNFVVHDDDAASAPAQVPSHDGVAGHGQEKSPPAPVRLILDQDSPSLAAESDATSLVAEAMPSGEKTVSYRAVFSADELHIRFRSLLI